MYRKLMQTLIFNDDKFTRVLKKKKSRGETKVYVSAEERKTLITSLGDAPAILYTYYVEKSGIEGFGYTDTQAAKALGWLDTKVKRHRLALTKAGWFKQVTLVQPTTKQKVTVTYLGKEMTAKVLTPTEFSQVHTNQRALCKAIGAKGVSEITKDPVLFIKAMAWMDKNL